MATYISARHSFSASSPEEQPRLRYSLGSEARFRTLIREIVALTGRHEFTLQLHLGALHSYVLNPDNFTFEDHRHERDIDCLVCRTIRDRRFALFVRCTDGETHGPIGSSCLFVHVLGDAQSQAMARRLEQIVRDAVHYAEHLRIVQGNRSHVLYLRALNLEWCQDAEAHAYARLSSTVQKRLAAWHMEPLAPLPRTVYEALHAETPRVQAFLYRRDMRRVASQRSETFRPPLPPADVQVKLDKLPPEHVVRIKYFWRVITPLLDPDRVRVISMNLKRSKIRPIDVEAVIEAIQQVERTVARWVELIDSNSLDFLERYVVGNDTVLIHRAKASGNVHDFLIKEASWKGINRIYDLVVGDAVFQFPDSRYADPRLVELVPVRPGWVTQVRPALDATEIQAVPAHLKEMACWWLDQPKLPTGVYKLVQLARSAWESDPGRRRQRSSGPRPSG